MAQRGVPRCALRTEYCQDEEIEEDEMGGACGTYGVGGKCAQDFGVVCVALVWCSAVLGTGTRLHRKYEHPYSVIRH
jgi:hypothetical protein